MKLGKTSWLLLAIGIFIITFIGLGVVRYQQVSEANQLSEELTVAGTKLNGFQLESLSAKQGKLEKKLSQTMSQFETARAELSQLTGSIAASSLLFDTAEAHGVTVTELSSLGPVSGELGGVSCSVLSLTARVEGDLSGLISFITELNNDLPTGFVSSVEISIPETTGGENSSANIQLVIYTYQGD